MAYSKKYEKELTYFLNKILDDSKNSVSGELHNAVLSRMQSLNDKSLNGSIKETELRLRINRLENIERELGLKDEII